MRSSAQFSVQKIREVEGANLVLYSKRIMVMKALRQTPNFGTAFGSTGLLLIVAAAGVLHFYDAQKRRANSALQVISRQAEIDDKTNVNKSSGESIAAVLATHRTLAPALRQWLESWASACCSDPSNLRDLIGRSDLNAEECLAIGTTIARAEDVLTAKVWIGAGFDRALAVLQKVSANKELSRPLLSRLVEAQNSLQGHVAAAELLERINRFLMQSRREAEWDQTPEWARIHHADALLLQGRDVQAQAEAMAMVADAQSDSHWTEQEVQELDLVIARIPFEPEARSPLDVLEKHKPMPAQLINWFRHRAAPGVKTSFQKSSDDFDPELADTVTKSDLTAVECLRIAEVARSSDSIAGEVFTRFGVDRASKQLSRLASDDRAALQLINSLKVTEDWLWDAPGDERSRGVILEKINATLERFSRVDPWDQTPEWARISHGEALFMEHRYAEAMAEANQLERDARSDHHFTAEEKIGIRWLQAIILFDTKRFAEAVPLLRGVATASSFQHSKDAWPLLSIALANAGDRNGANQVFDEWIRRCLPSVDRAARVLELIQGESVN